MLSDPEVKRKESIRQVESKTKTKTLVQSDEIRESKILVLGLSFQVSKV